MLKAEDSQQKVHADDFLRICLEAVLVWGKANEQNKKSKFYEAFQSLKEKQVKFPSELKFFGQVRRPLLKDSLEISSKQSLRGTSPPTNNTETIFTLMEKYDEIRLYIKDELGKALRNPNHKVDVYKATHKLNKFYDAFRPKFARLSTDSEAYERFSDLNEMLKDLTKRLKHDGLDYRQMVRLLERSLF